MVRGFHFSFRRLLGIVIKELIQLRRDRLTFAMIFGIPLAQLFLFGYVINSDPRHLPAGIVIADHGPQARAILKALEQSTFFDFAKELESEEDARRQLALGELQFVINIPQNFSRDLVRGDKPVILLEADATDPSATLGALSQIARIVEQTLTDELTGPLAYLAPSPPPVEVRHHALYNPESKTTYNIVPGLIGVILTLTMAMITALAITRERERGTMENLLSMPTRPSEVLIGKITPYIIIGYAQVALILLVARYVFGVPIHGSVPLLLAVSLLFIVANLSLGITFSTIAKNQLQAMQMAMFIFLPSMLLSGFMFPFRGMPQWAQIAGEILPITHFLRIARGIMLKGNGFVQIAPELWPIGLFTFVVLVIGIKRYRLTLD
jgi:ABC-2 type transport system permease protein